MKISSIILIGAAALLLGSRRSAAAQDQNALLSGSDSNQSNTLNAANNLLSQGFNNADVINILSGSIPVYSQGDFMNPVNTSVLTGNIVPNLSAPSGYSYMTTEGTPFIFSFNPMIPSNVSIDLGVANKLQQYGITYDMFANRTGGMYR